MTISAPPPNSTFHAPATVTIEGQVDLPEGEWFALRVFKLPVRIEPSAYNSRIDAVHIATLTTNKFTLQFTNLAAFKYEYSFHLYTLDSSSVSNVVAFAVTNFSHRLGPYNITDLGTLGGTQTMAFAINNRGQAAGKSRNGSDKDRAVLFENGAIVDLGTLGGPASRAYGINDKGEMVGSAEKTSGLSVPFLYRTGKMEDLGFTEAGDALDINDRGDIVGNSGGGFAILDGVKSTYWYHIYDINNRRQVAGGPTQIVVDDLHFDPPFVDDPTEVGFIDSKVYGRGSAYAINEAREITGMAEDGDHREYRVAAFRYAEGHIEFSTSGDTRHAAGLGINRWGEIVGSYLPRWSGYSMGRPTTMPPTPSELQDKEAFIKNNRGFANLNTLISSNAGWVLLEATDINDAGQVVGFGRKDGEVRAFRLDPVVTMTKLQISGDRITGKVQAAPGATVEVEASSDFKEWRPVMGGTATSYELEFSDQSPEAAVFYRAVISGE